MNLVSQIEKPKNARINTAKPNKFAKMSTIFNKLRDKLILIYSMAKINRLYMEILPSLTK